jgi:hypothetical protein
LAVGICDCVDVVRDGLGDGFDFSVTVTGEDFGLGLGRAVVRGGFCLVVDRRCVSVVGGLTVLPGVVTASDATVVVVVVVVSLSPFMWRRT